MNKDLFAISSLIKTKPNYQNIKSRINFDLLDTEQKDEHKEPHLQFLPKFCVCMFGILTIVLVPSLCVIFLSNKSNPGGGEHITLMDKCYSEEIYELPSLDNDVIKIDNLLDFSQYLKTIKSSNINDFSNIITNDFFQKKCLIGITFISSLQEVSCAYDGKGIMISKIDLNNDNLSFDFTIPTKGKDQVIIKNSYFAFVSKNDIADDFHYTYRITQRDTGLNGSCYYNNENSL